MRWDEVGPCALSQPTNQTNHTLVFLLAFEERWAVIGFVGFRACIDGWPQATWSSIGSDIARVDVVVFNEVSCEAGLTEVDQYFVVVT